ncbi:MAG: YraN family protein [Candidatus Adiutrix sp.]|jgi:putative endonuclease|nr:YraN family protein [Candidatus Adiutrix sp.]
MDKRHELGHRGEDMAAGHLETLGYKLAARNHVNRLGELDLVALDGETVVVVEVKSRSRAGRPPSEAVNLCKRRKLVQVALLFLKFKRWQDRPVRFDVVEVVAPPGEPPVINHIPRAFEADGL